MAEKSSSKLFLCLYGAGASKERLGGWSIGDIKQENCQGLKHAKRSITYTYHVVFAHGG